MSAPKVVPAIVAIAVAVTVSEQPSDTIGFCFLECGYTGSDAILKRRNVLLLAITTMSTITKMPSHSALRKPTRHNKIAKL